MDSSIGSVCVLNRNDFEFGITGDTWSRAMAEFTYKWIDLYFCDGKYFVNGGLTEKMKGLSFNVL